MDNPNPMAVESWPQAVVMIAVLLIPALFAYLNGRSVKRTLTTNNGGSTVKDQLDRIEGSVTSLNGRVTILETAAATTPGQHRADA